MKIYKNMVVELEQVNNRVWVLVLLPVSKRIGITWGEDTMYKRFNKWYVVSHSCWESKYRNRMSLPDFINKCIKDTNDDRVEFRTMYRKKVGKYTEREINTILN